MTAAIAHAALTGIAIEGEPRPVRQYFLGGRTARGKLRRCCGRVGGSSLVLVCFVRRWEKGATFIAGGRLFLVCFAAVVAFLHTVKLARGLTNLNCSHSKSSANKDSTLFAHRNTKYRSTDLRSLASDDFSFFPKRLTPWTPTFPLRWPFRFAPFSPEKERGFKLSTFRLYMCKDSP